MGTWAFEWAPGGGLSVYRMAYFNGDVFGFAYSSGIWQRTPPNWTQTTAAERACVWAGQMWAAIPLGAGRVDKSNDGVNWVVDWNPGIAPFDHWSAFNGCGPYLRCGSRNSGAPLGNHFYRRSTAGNWVETPIDQADPNHFHDIVNFGGRGGNDDIYLSALTADVYKWSWGAGVWINEPTLDNLGTTFFTEHGGTLYATAGDEIYRRGSCGDWVLDCAALGGAWDFGGAISVGGDGLLYVAANDGVNSRVYVRVGGGWSLHSTAGGVRFHSVVADGAGNLYAGTDNRQFWAYTVDFAVTPVGLGLPPQQMDVDADGDALYVALYNAAAQPILIKAPAPLVHHAVGTAVFNPLAGNAINVKCGGVGGELAISGLLSAGGNDSVQVSEDGGATPFVDIAPNWGDTAQPLLVDPDDAANRVLVALAGAQSITETADGGGTWLVNNPGPIGYALAAMAKLPEGDELVIGDAHAARKVEYSPNRGVTLADITGGAAIGNVVALEVA